jgi:hypothetical protein
VTSLDETSERSITQAIVRYLRRLPSCHVVKYHGNPYSEGGQPDLFGAYKGLAFLLEVKRASGDATPRQIAVMRKWRKAGAIAQVVRSVAEVKAIIAKIDARIERGELRVTEQAARSGDDKRGLGLVAKQRRVAARLRESLSSDAP